MSKVLKPVEQKKSVADCIQDVGASIDAFFAPHTPYTESKQLPLRADILTFEDDALDFGWYKLIDTLTIDHAGNEKHTKRLVTVMA